MRPIEHLSKLTSPPTDYILQPLLTKVCSLAKGLWYQIGWLAVALKMFKVSFGGLNCHQESSSSKIVLSSYLCKACVPRTKQECLLFYIQVIFSRFHYAEVLVGVNELKKVTKASYFQSPATSGLESFRRNPGGVR